MLAVISIISLLAWSYLALSHGRFWQPFFPRESPAPDTWPSVDIIVPARNEAEALPQSLPSLLDQDYPGEWRIILVDDHSSDGTADVARKLGGDRITIINAPELETEWKNGKLAALNAGVAQSTADYILFTDADILHSSDNLSALMSRAVERNLGLVSLMVKLHCETFAEKLLIPAFVFFFAMLYPFRRANDPRSSLAAAAGGVILLRRVALDKIGGLASIKSQLIDDCALAREIKKSGEHIELGLSPDVKSLRVYPKIADVWRMVARTAYTQLHYSPLYLLGTIIGLCLLFLVPTLFPIFGSYLVAEAGLAAWLIMTILYLPTIRLYELPPAWAFMLPAAAIIYMVATVDSARLYWQGKGGMWKGRSAASS